VQGREPKRRQGSQRAQTEDKTALKPAVIDILANNGAYVLATTKTNTTTPKPITAPAKKAKKFKAKAKKTKRMPTSIPKLKYLVGLIRGTLSHYANAADTEIRVYGAPKLSDWINSHPMIAIWTKMCLGIASPTFPFQTIEDWADYPIFAILLSSGPNLTITSPISAMPSAALQK